MAIGIQTSDMKRAIRYFERNSFDEIIITEEGTHILIRPIANPSVSVIVRPKDAASPDKVELTERKPMGNPG